MKTTTLPLLILIVLFSATAAADIYKSVDDDGNVLFTDTPSSTQPREKVTLKPITKLHSPTASTQPPAKPVDKKVNSHRTYDVFTITSPANNSTVRNNGTFTIKLLTKPTLSKTHKIRFVIDGKATGAQKSLSYKVENLDRGTHHIKAELLNSSGGVEQATESTVHVQRAIARPPKPSPAP